jgi:acetyl-CoA acyltransferase
MKEEVFVVGVGMTRFGRWLDRSLKSLVAEAVIQALKDANCQASDVEAAFFSNTTQSIIEGQHLIRGQIALREIGIESIPIVNVENACASGSTAFYQAINHLRGGAAEIALVVGAEKMYDADRVKSAAVFDGGWDVHESKALAERLVSIGAGFPTPAGRGPGVASPFMELYASLAKGHMSKFGTTERQLATVAAKNHRHSTLNPLSQ